MITGVLTISIFKRQACLYLNDHKLKQKFLIELINLDRDFDQCYIYSVKSKLNSFIYFPKMSQTHHAIGNLNSSGSQNSLSSAPNPHPEHAMIASPCFTTTTVINPSVTSCDIIIQHRLNNSFSEERKRNDLEDGLGKLASCW